MNYLRIWDESSVNRVDHFIANSTTVQKRINSIYRRDANVIYPPIETKKLSNHISAKSGNYYITVGRLVPYKRVDLMIEAFNKMKDRKLIILGDGNDRERLNSLVKSDNIQLKGFVSEETKLNLLSKAKGFIFCAEEDFGMSPVEAMAAGIPLIAFNKAGVKDYLKEGINGIGFPSQTVEDLINAVKRFEATSFDRDKVATTVQKFNISNFRENMKEFISEKYHQP
jgi:glycosyltransferase involved in cell wall biosynthesis